MRHYQRGIVTSIILIIFLIAGVTIVSGYFIFAQNQQKLKSVNSFEDCAKYYPVMESYPEQCSTPDGKHFTRQLTEEEKQDRLVPPLPPSPSPLVGETVNWKTYIREGEFQYSYPTDWIINEVIPPQGFSNVGDPKTIYPDGYLSIERVFSRKDCGFEEKEILQGYIQKNLKQYDQLLNGVTAKIFEGILVKEKEEYDRKIILIYHNDACFKLDYSSNNSNQETVLDKIISSFKLLN